MLDCQTLPVQPPESIVPSGIFEQMAKLVRVEVVVGDGQYLG